MKRILLILALCLAPTVIHAGDVDKNLHRKILYPTIALTAKVGMGTAVVVRSRKDGETWLNTAFTAEHVIRSGSVKVGVPRYRDWSRIERTDEYTAEVVRADPKKDAAVLTFRTPGQLHAAEIDWHPRLYIGNRVAKVGAGLGLQPRLDYGHVTSLDSPGEDSAPLLRISASTVAGDSGGGVYHASKLIALVEMLHLQPTQLQPVPANDIGYAMPIRDAFTRADLK